MPDKKDNQAPPTKEQLLEERVDAMMDAKRPVATPEQSSEPAGPAEKTDDSLPPLDIFAGQTSAPKVPKELLNGTDIKEPKPSRGAPKEGTAEAGAETPAAQDTEPVPPRDIPDEVALDDEVSDAAVDDIVAEESDTVLAVEDAATRQAAAEQPARPAHRHPVFWALIAILAIAAIAVAVLFATGGNISLPKI